MKRFLLCLSFIFAAASSAFAQHLTSEELQRATDHLQKTSAAFLAATNGLSDAQLNFKAAPNRWSVAEVSEHIASAEDFLMGLITDKVMKAPGRAQPDDVKAIDTLVLQAIADRSHKLQAPEPLIPVNRFQTTAGSRDHFKASRAKTIAFVKETEGLRDHAIDSPLGKQLDAYEWVLFISAHSERHTKQIDEVKADASFPKS